MTAGIPDGSAVPMPSRSLARWTRKEVREALVNRVGDGLPKLADWIDGRTRVLVGFGSAAELAARFHELRQRRRLVVAEGIEEAVRWEDVDEHERAELIDTFSELTGGGLSVREIALQVSAAQQLQAYEIAAKYGLGTQVGAVDEEGNSVMPGMVVMPPLEIEGVRHRQAMRVLASGRVEVPVSEDVQEMEGFSYVIEDIETTAGMPEADYIPPPPVEETVNPAVVEIIKRRRNRNIEVLP